MSQHVISGITWSYSRRSTLEQCCRRYYYDYFGANKQTARREQFKERLHFLKNRVQNRYLLSGSVLHTVIRSYFKYAQRGEVWDTDRLVGFARKVYGESWAYSEKHPDGKFIPSGPYPPKLLLEYYDQQPGANHLCAEEETRLVDAVRSFAEESVFEEFLAVGSRKDASIELTMSLGHFPCKVTGKVDLACKTGSHVTIVDWKLGTNDGTGDNSLQLAVYALWGVDYFRCEPENLRACKAHLSSHDIAQFRIDDQTLAAARARIIQDATRMDFLKSYGQNADVDAFTRCDKSAICGMCPYRSVCSD